MRMIWASPRIGQQPRMNPAPCRPQRIATSHLPRKVSAIQVARARICSEQRSGVINHLQSITRSWRERTTHRRQRRYRSQSRLRDQALAHRRQAPQQAGGNGEGAVPGLVRGFRTRPRQTRWSPPAALDPATAALLPDSFQTSEAGHIPKGWTVSTPSSLTRFLSRHIQPSYLDHGGVCVLNQKPICDHRIDFSKACRHNSAKKPINDRTVKVHDVLVNSTGMGTLGRVAQVLHLPEMAIIDFHVTIVQHGPDTDPFFLGIGFTGRETEVEELGKGSTGQTELSRARLGQLKIITSPSELQKAFGTTVGPLLGNCSENNIVSRTLATLQQHAAAKAS